MRTGIAFAQHWSGQYQRVGGPVDLPTDCEDAGIYFSQSMQVFRIVLHCNCNYQSVWSRDGIAWRRTAPQIPWCNVTYTDGHSELMKRRERPKWLVDAQGQPSLLLTGVQPTVSHEQQTFTMMSEILP